MCGAIQSLFSIGKSFGMFWWEDILNHIITFQIIEKWYSPEDTVTQRQFNSDSSAFRSSTYVHMALVEYREVSRLSYSLNHLDWDGGHCF